MSRIGTATVEIGDILRHDSNDREGRVIGTSGDDVTVQLWGTSMSDGEVIIAPVTKWYYNTWDAKYKSSGKQAPNRKPSDMTPK